MLCLNDRTELYYTCQSYPVHRPIPIFSMLYNCASAQTTNDIFRRVATFAAALTRPNLRRRFIMRPFMYTSQRERPSQLIKATARFINVIIPSSSGLVIMQSIRRPTYGVTGSEKLRDRLDAAVSHVAEGGDQSRECCRMKRVDDKTVYWL